MKLFSPKQNKTSHGTSYYIRENVVHTYGDLRNIYTPKGKILHNTSEVIVFNNISLSQITEKLLTDTFGEAHHVIDELNDIDNYKIIFYRHSAGPYNYLMQFHFYENNFLFVNNIIRLSYVLGNSDKKSIMNRLQEKYYPDFEFDFTKGFELQIKDVNNNFLYTTDSVNFSITYINNTQVLKEMLKKGITDSTSENKFEGII